MRLSSAPCILLFECAQLFLPVDFEVDFTLLFGLVFFLFYKAHSLGSSAP